MNIAITGSSPDHCGEYDQHSSGNLSWSLLECLEVAEHSAWKCRGYSETADLQIVFFDPFNWGEPDHLVGALMALGQRLKNQQPVMVGFSDNMFYVTRQHFEDYRGSVLFKRRFGHLPETQQTFIRTLLERFTADPLPPAFVQVFPWADTVKLKEILRVGDLIALDPTGTEPTPWVSVGRERRWIFGTNKPTRAWWPDGTWPLEVYSKHEGTWIPREQLFAKYGASWGVVAQKYTFADIGWWRNRYVHAAAGGNILLTHPTEARPLGKDYKVSREEVEGLSDMELADLATQQASWFFQHTWNRDMMVARVSQVLEDYFG